MANPIAVPGTVVPSGNLVTPGGAQGVQGLQGIPGSVGGYTASQSVLLTGTNFTLAGDQASPPGGQFYGYSGGVKGWFTPPSATGTTYTGSQSVLLSGSNFTLLNDAATPALGQYYGYRNGARGWFVPDFINVLDYGADPTGSADATTAIQNAANAMPGVLYFPAGTYKVSSAITISKAGIVLGSGKWGSIITTNSATANIFHDTYGASTYECLGFNSSVTRTGGYYLDFGSSFANSTGLRIRDCLFYNYFNAIQFPGPDGIEDLQIRDCTFYSLVNGGTGITFWAVPCTDVQVINCQWFGGGSTQTGILINVIGNLILDNCCIQSIGIGLSIGATGSGANAVTQVTVKACVIDSCTCAIVLQASGSGVLTTTTISDTWCVTARATLPCLVIQANDSSTVQGVQIINSQFIQTSSGTQDGINLYCHPGALLERIIISNCRIEANGGSGITMNGGGGIYPANINIANNLIIGNLLHGINISASLPSWRIIGNQITNNHGYGVACGGSNNNFIIALNFLSSNTGGGMSGVPTSGNFVNANNI